ncbi:uncharacterized protein LOC133810188 [Humulus lupulus]|uniref:uncharacterized protein LOC133810188 n=1 Tax=Humulus lupulus TaxID=3486 RepID=UPI002B412600|nr:uncharacterized protein LOC133810188 [Humulus lupulus]
MKKRSVSHDLGTYPSPGAPQYRGNTGGSQKGWASERLPPPATSIGGGLQIGSSSSAALMSFNSGRTLPSKWEDAERWICSPVFGQAMTSSSSSSKCLNNNNNNSQYQKRPKSKSGPIVHPATGYYSNHSPAAVVEGGGGGGGSLRSCVAASGSPFSTGVLAAESVFSSGVGVGVGQLSRMATVPIWPELGENSANSNSTPSPKKDGESSISRTVSKREMANQMSTPNKDCARSSMEVGRLSLTSSPPALLSIMEQHSDDHSGKIEVKDVQVDKRATMTRWSKKRGIRISKKDKLDVNNNDLSENALAVSASSFDVSESAMDNSKWQREEAKIIAWENLQKAKAEAAIRKLEMKLEKKRSATMDKIIDKLRTSQYKAHKMRTNLSANESHSHSHSHEVLKTPRKFFCLRKQIRVGLLGRFFTCRAF